ncbi:MAG: 3',5'-cyclic-nucleotide phosphodiesterase [Hydrotalea flava]|uniref:MBL fold metallo-hydrolase n=1 Tax=Hydrotalea TaxID=1004300 RepID=UPI000941CE26|nr:MULTISPECIES: 3',5'-cyclic-nucleotide phosphodiesterase [Hydrotalea]NIM35305.1 3',5'-cyclic-nucleotide phosphodiesterase [Hydrotalea flava]NIM38164.1 3',5'-cyclic-nucleotide phosphodiesterase [Hydrotalea flava]NIN03328.1 3',5'-cyclic-nucleotide phosphodiesterase [Hydrotalea flava]NIN15022.1 3',5'-cyclic-nucleotide phosphodiesterase [Hydrotalea flava]NIO94090.1 3',5'-cyclic-nucleotide phosphodiesterase [Hydrotalea flava]
MIYLRYRLVVMVFLFMGFQLLLQAQKPVFKVVPLGVKGGLDESNLSAYLIAVNGTSRYIALDAGTIDAGIQKAIQKKLWKGTTSTAVLQDSIKGYCISHGHLDHVAGLIINAPNDSKKNIYAMPYCLQVLEQNYFTWQSWANFGDAGTLPFLNKYHYVPLATGREVPLEGTDMMVTPFVLSHGSNYKSTAFLVRYQSGYLLYLGDTGADTIEHSHDLLQLWQCIAPFVQQKKLKAIFIEVSYPNEQPENQLFGHLTPKLLLDEMHVLVNLTGINAVQGLPIVITHMKPSGNNEAIIQRQLLQNNALQLQFIFAQQAVPLFF